MVSAHRKLTWVRRFEPMEEAAKAKDWVSSLFGDYPRSDMPVARKYPRGRMALRALCFSLASTLPYWFLLQHRWVAGRFMRTCALHHRSVAVSSSSCLGGTERNKTGVIPRCCDPVFSHSQAFTQSLRPDHDSILLATSLLGLLLKQEQQRQKQKHHRHSTRSRRRAHESSSVQ